MWDAYTVCAVLSGILLLVGSAVVPDQTPKNRAYFALAGAASAGYGWYVAHQTSGTYYFPVQVFLVPVIAVGYLAYSYYQSMSGQSATVAAATPAAAHSTASFNEVAPAVSTGVPTPDAGPGWYADPVTVEGAFRRRWWDGASWTDRTDPGTTSDHSLDLTALEPPRVRR